MIDGVVLPRQLVDAFARGEQARVPVVGWFQRGEIRSLPFLMPTPPARHRRLCRRRREGFGDKAKAYLAVYPDADPKADVMASIRDGLYGFAAQYLVRQQATAGQPSYLYYFRHGTPAQAARGLTAFHASELPYVFGQVGEGRSWGRTGRVPPLTAEETALSDRHDGLLGFVRSQWRSDRLGRDGVAALHSPGARLPRT
ncbi:hypothetical protein ACRAWD_17670 [Caulobacter segnis]